MSSEHVFPNVSVIGTFPMTNPREPKAPGSRHVEIVTERTPKVFANCRVGKLSLTACVLQRAAVC